MLVALLVDSRLLQVASYADIFPKKNFSVIRQPIQNLKKKNRVT